MVKSAKEIKYLVKAAKITVAIYRAVADKVKPGAREIEIARGIENIIRKKRLRRSFRTIVASGPNAAKPHAKVTTRKIRAGDTVVIDFGVIYKGYHSDMTRTVMVGNVSRTMRKLYSVVKTAQKNAIRKVMSGVKISCFTRGVHDYMRKMGMGKYMMHSLGHGVGKKIHECPRLSEKNNHTLKENTVITIEPGLYIKNRGGVRIEDMVLVGKKGNRVLTV